MDRITRALITDFFETQEKIESDLSEDFEYFSNYSVVSNEYNKTFDPDSLVIGGGQDTGIDGIAIIVNGQLIEYENEIDDLLESNGYLEVSYIFIQSKTSSNFDTAEMHKFYYGITDFFSETPSLKRNSDIQKINEISEYLLTKASSFKENPVCKIYYVTTGVYDEKDSNIEAVRSDYVRRLESLNLFEDIQSNMLGANEIGKLYRKTKNPISATFIFANKVTLKEIDDINQSYYGVIPFKEFKKIIIDESHIIRNVFDDNVRDFQGGNNPVNKNIAETISGNASNLFSVMNNGVTIVASTLKSLGNNMTIFDYQIVNGCQTSNVLYEFRDQADIDDMEIPIRLIVTEDEDIKSKITVSTNNQTAIKKEQLSVMSEFQKNLELYYKSITGDGKLYYERRAKQYNSDADVTKRKIITVSNQIKSFSSMFLNNPHMVTSYYGTIVKKIGEDESLIFKKDHQYAPYYLAGLAYYRLDSLFNSGIIDSKYKKIRYFVLMLVPKIASETTPPNFCGKSKTERYCDPIISILNDPIKTEELFKKAVSIIDASNININDKQLIKTKASTDDIIDKWEEIKLLEDAEDAISNLE